MVTKRIRSEYMKKFKDPKWETYVKCYEEMLKYRLSRRLLEHAHNPMLWSGSDTDSEASPPPPSKNQVQSDTGKVRTEAELEECEGARMDPQQQPTDVPRLSLPEEEEEEDVSAAHVKERCATEEQREEPRAGSRNSKQITVAHEAPERDPGGSRPRPSKPLKMSNQTRRPQWVKPRQPMEESKDGKHPFALYGSGEKEADIAGRKTHNVGPAASTNEIHGSALRAKTRREVERQIQTRRTERRRAKSTDADKPRKLSQSEFNPWLTEYMRCFSARTR